MSDLVESFEVILKKHCTKSSLALYGDNKQQNKHTLKPLDVISSVSSQLKAIQVADSFKLNKSISKDLNKYKKCTYLSVNKLPVYEEQPKQCTKFDTQCVTDTQLINVIEDAEILDVHRGMTQEFETPFSHLNTEKQIEDIHNVQNHIGLQPGYIETIKESDICKRNNVTDGIGHVVIKDDQCEKETDNSNERNDILNNSNTTKNENKNPQINCLNYMNEMDNNIIFVSKDIHENTQEQYSKILSSKTVADRFKKPDSIDTDIPDENYTETEHPTQILNQCIEIEVDNNTEEDQPPSPIFINKNIKTKSKSPSPLVFNLDKFEQFESIAISLLESNDFYTAKRVINSQILDKELHLKMNEEVELNERDKLSSVLEKDIDEVNLGSPIIETDIKPIEIDKALSEEILKQLTNKVSKDERKADAFKDEILFSSDEEDINKEYQDLPFTCALETSFYDQSDVLDKTMYVGFQTASNRSIQVGTGSFAKAKSIMQDVTNDDITITELVKSCDNSIKDTSNVEKVKMNANNKDKEFNLAENAKYLECNAKEDTVNNIPKDSNIKKAFNNKSSIGFTTANNKIINLSEQALARCKKVFQDIDLNDNFDLIETDDSVTAKHCEQKIELCTDDNKIQNAKENINPIDLLQGIDDEIIQEFENIEMSLEDDKREKEVKSPGNIDVINETVEKIKDLDCDKDLDDNHYENQSAEEVILSQIISNLKVKNETKTNKGFRTAGNKIINISKQSLAKSRNIFSNIDNTEFPNKFPKHLDKDTNVGSNCNQPKSSKAEVVGFRTAINNNFEITNVPLAKTNDISNNIDTPDIKMKSLKNHIDTSNINTINMLDINQPSTSKGFGGFRTANNKNIRISEKAWSKTKNIFNDIDSIELPKKENKENSKVDSIAYHSKTENRFVGFKASNNNNILIPKEASAKTKHMFNNTDSPNSVYPKSSLDNTNIDKIPGENTILKDIIVKKSVSNKERIEFSNKTSTQADNVFKVGLIEESELTTELLEEIERAASLQTINPIEPATTEINFIGFKTANNKAIKISNDALAKTRNIFKDVDSEDFKLLDKSKNDYPDFEENYSADEDKSLTKKESVVTSAEKDTPTFQGFKTASNKHVIVSSKALMKSKKIFKDIDKNVEFVRKDETAKEKDIYPTEFINKRDALARPTSSVFEGFKTANKKPVTVSKNALEESKKMFKETGFSGFQTASNKEVKISEKALAKSRKLFNDINTNENTHEDNEIVKEKALYPEEIYQGKPLEDVVLSEKVEEVSSGFKGFYTANKNPVAISKTALEKSKKLFQDIDVKSDFCGFQTGNNKEVHVSEKALTESKKLFDIDKPENHSFKGFQTASNKNVKVSKEALTKTKKIFQDFWVENDIFKDNKSIKYSDFNIGFQTGNNNAITVSKEALARSKRLFSEIDNVKDNKNERKEKITKINEEIHDIIDTQVINNFDESLHTEDFQVTPNINKSKRSGSPILSCPRAKKRKKFETPYNTKNIPKPLLNTTEKAKIENKITFSENYKKNKKYTLKDLANMTKGLTIKIDPYFKNFDFDTLLKFEFNNDRNGLSNSSMTIDLLKATFLNSINAKLVPNGWLDNHIKLILWKLISYEIKFKSAVVCTARHVMDQLKYRYDRELYNAERPALRKIFEKDDVPSKTMVLCVVGIYVDGVKVTSVTNPQSNIELLLSDGWYCIRCTIDAMLSQLVFSNKICVGGKIVTCGAELSGSEQAVAPWEDTSSIRLKIFGNSTRRARWDARLGYRGDGAILCPLSSINVLGGKVSKLRVYVTRVYPALYVEKFEDGSTVTRSERLENIHQMKTEAERQAFMEKLYEEVEREFADQESQDSEGLSDSYKRSCMDSGSQIAKMMKRCKDPAEFRAQLSTSQAHLLETHTSKNRDRLLQDIQTRVRDKVEKGGVCVNRNVITLLKIRVAGVIEKGDRVEVSKAMMSIWKPNDAIREIIKEGVWIDVLNVVPTAVRYSEIQISAGRQSVFSSSKYKPSEKIKPYINLLHRNCYTIKDLSQNPSMCTDYNEIDTVGLIFLIDPSIKEFDSTKQSFQNVYLADADKNIICVNFWGGLKKFGYHNVLDTGQFVTCVNLQKRAGNTKKTIPQYRVTEFSYFTQTPKNENARKILDDMNKKFVSLDRRKFCQDCILLKNNYTVIKQNNENISPYRFINNDINISKNKLFIDSPLVNKDDNLNLTGLDFESTFKQDTELSDEVLKRKRKVNEKIAKLKMYGEPPPLSPIHIINRSKQASSSYKSPLLLNNNNSTNITPINNNKKCKNENSNLNVKSDSCINVASIQNTPQKCGENITMDNSLVLLNKTYVKNVNPVKINFDMKDNNDSIDHFAEEFDGSPPLSLD